MESNLDEIRADHAAREGVRSERHPWRQRPGVIVLTECRGRDLDAGAHCEAESIVDGESAQRHSGCDEQLIVSDVRARSATGAHGPLRTYRMRER